MSKQRAQVFENLVVSNKCKTAAENICKEISFENLVVSNKCKTDNPVMTVQILFENLVVSNKYKKLVAKVTASLQK